MSAQNNKKPQGPKGPELCLRFRCAHCQEVLVLPVRHLAGAKNDCPTCAQPVWFPKLDEATSGFAEVVAAGHGNEPRSIGCPVCHSRLELNGDLPGAGKKCPRCHEWLVLRLVPEKRAGGQPPVQKTAQANSPATDVRSAPGSTPPPKRVVPPSPAPPIERSHATSEQPRKESRPPPSRPSPSQGASPTSATKPRPGTGKSATPQPSGTARQTSYSEEAIFFDDPPSPKSPSRPKNTSAPKPSCASEAVTSVREEAPSPVLYDGTQAGNPTSARRSSGGGLSSSPRLVRGLLFFALQLGGPALTIAFAIASGATCIVVLGVLWFLFGWLPSFWIAHYLTPAFITHIRCPGCYEEYEAVDIWKCSCGYQDHKQRHMLSFHCPVCRKWLARMDCYRCGSTILVR